MSSAQSGRSLAILGTCALLAVVGTGGVWAAGLLPRDWTNGVQNTLSAWTGGRVSPVGEPPVYVKAAPEENGETPTPIETQGAGDESAELLTQTESDGVALDQVPQVSVETEMPEQSDPTIDSVNFEPAAPLAFARQTEEFPVAAETPQSPPPAPKLLPEQAEPTADLEPRREEDAPVIDEPEPAPLPKPTPVPTPLPKTKPVPKKPSKGVRSAPTVAEKLLPDGPSQPLKNVPEPIPEKGAPAPSAVQPEAASVAPTTAGKSSAGLGQKLAPIAEIEDKHSSAKPLRGFVEIEQLIQQGDLPTALAEYSRWYWRMPEQRAELQPKLDQLAEQVFFTPRPHFHEPYVIQPGDQLRSISKKYNLPWEYVAKLNKVDARKIRAGQKLKVVDGPFSAFVCLENYELIVHLRGVYVRRYRIGAGKSGSTPVGNFVVKEKLVDPTYYGDDGVIAHDNPKNPLGERWIDIGDSYGIHGTIDPSSIGRNESRGCIRLLNEDVAEVYDLLSIGSKVSITK